MSYESIRTIIELQSLAFTLPVLLLCFLVVYECVPTIPHAQRNTQMRWILLGITIGFTGNLVDNFYWMIPWTSNYLGLPQTPDLVNFGVFPNLLFRQIFTIVAAYCHLRAFISPSRPKLIFCCNMMFFGSILLGQFFIIYLQKLN